MLTSSVGNIHLNIRIVAATVPMDTNHISKTIRLPIHQVVPLLNSILKVPPSEETKGEGLVVFEEDSNSVPVGAGDFAVDSRMPSGMPTQALAGPSSLNLYQVY
jgi:hypothetical protein